MFKRTIWIVLLLSCGSSEHEQPQDSLRSTPGQLSLGQGIGIHFKTSAIELQTCLGQSVASEMATPDGLKAQIGLIPQTIPK
jgi:hypothetical protein